MATATDRNLISRVRISAQKLGVAAKWSKSGTTVKVEDHFLFEMYVLFELILDLMSNYNIVYIPGSGSDPHAFPRRPSLKQDCPKFEVWQKTQKILLWQICAGTQIDDIWGKPRGPDISLQAHNATDTPTYQDVEMIWDAKYRKNNTYRITHPELADFGRWVELLEVHDAANKNLVLNRLREMLGNCLVTNGQQSTEPDNERNRLKIKEVFSFYPNETFNVKP